MKIQKLGQYSILNKNEGGVYCEYWGVGALSKSFKNLNYNIEAVAGIFVTGVSSSKFYNE